MRQRYRVPILDPNADLRQEQDADYRFFQLAGSHYEIGYQMGRATPLRVVEHHKDVEAELAFAAACAEVVARYHPALHDEFRGFADAQGRMWEEVLPHFSLNLPEGMLSGCTTLVWRLPDSRVLIARNYDFLYTQRQRYLRRLYPNGYPATLGTQAGLIGSCYDGVNSHGVFVALHLIHAQSAQSVPPGIPYHLVPRLVLETCRSAREAASLLRELPHLFPFNYLIADAEEMVCVEAYPGRVRLRYPERGNYLVVTNHFAHPDMRPLQGARQLTSQYERVRWIKGRIEEITAQGLEDGWEWATELLRDHTAPMCHHRPTQATLWSLVADLSERRIAYCQGAPCRNSFVEHLWPGMLELSGHLSTQMVRMGWDTR